MTIFKYKYVLHLYMNGPTNGKQNYKTAILLLLKEKPLYGRQIKSELNIRHDKTVFRILNDLVDEGFVKKIQCMDFIDEKIQDDDCRHVYYKYIGNEISPQEENKRKVWNKIMYNLKNIVKGSSTEKVLKLDDNERKKIESFFEEFLWVKGKEQTTPIYRYYSNFVSLNDLYFLLNLLRKLDNDLEEKYQIGMIQFIKECVIRLKGQGKQFPEKFESIIQEYFKDIFDEWIDEENKWDQNNSNKWIIKEIIVIFSIIEYKEIWQKIFSEFFVENNFEKLKENYSEEPYNKLLEFLKSIMLLPNQFIKDVFSSHEYQLFELQQVKLSKDEKAFEFFKQLRMAIL